MAATETIGAADRAISRRNALVLLALANALWGSAWPVAKVATAELAPPLLAALRVTLAAGLFGAVLWWQRARSSALIQPEGVSRGLLLRMAGLGVVALGVSYLLIYSGVGLTTASDGSLMIIGEVIFTTLLAAWLAHEPLDRRKIGGVLLGSAGVAVLVLGGAAFDTGGGLARVTGAALILGGLLIQATYSVIGAGMSRRVGPLITMAVVYAGSLLVWAPLFGWYALRGELMMPSPGAILAIVYLAAIPSVACNLIWFSVIRRHGASLGAVSLFIQPIVGALIGIAALGDPVTLPLLAGGALILAALALLVHERR